MKDNFDRRTLLKYSIGSAVSLSSFQLLGQQDSDTTTAVLGNSLISANWSIDFTDLDREVSELLSLLIETPWREISGIEGDYIQKDADLRMATLELWTEIDSRQTMDWASPILVSDNNEVLTIIKPTIAAEWVQAMAVNDSRSPIVSHQPSATIATSDTLALAEVRTKLEPDFQYFPGIADSDKSGYDADPMTAANKFVVWASPSPEVVMPIPVPNIRERQKNISTDLIVLMDILFQSLGIVVNEDGLIEEIINSDQEISTKLEELWGHISTEKWEDTLQTLEKLFIGVVLGNTGNRVLEEISKRTKKKITFGLAIRCVPVYGWAYCIIAFIICAKKNYERFSFAEQQ